ncbi:MAG TPA: Plug domain-containing protein [Polyangia bacterium]|nr:Plug domain-containing protein [Polyangia bacterium]
MSAALAFALLSADVPPPATAPLEIQAFTRGSRKPLTHADVVVDLATVGETDEHGHLTVTVACGTRRIGVHAPGYESQWIERDACVDASPIVARLDQRDDAPRYETTVRGVTTRQEFRLQGDELVHTAGTLGDPFRAVESLPGVSAVAWPAPVYAVRGGNPGNTGFLLDDLRVPTLFHFALGPSVIHPYFFEGLDFWSGGAPARYGRYVAGLVAARTREAPDDMVHATVDVRLFDAGAMVTSPLPGGGSVAAAARYSYTGTVVGLFDSSVKLSYWDYQLRADRPVGAWRLTLLAFGSSDVLSTTSSLNGLALEFHRVKLRAEAPLAGGRFFASVGAGTDHSNVPLDQTTGVALAVDAKSVIPRVGYTHHTARTESEVGLDGELVHYAPL